MKPNFAPALGCLMAVLLSSCGSQASSPTSSATIKPAEPNGVVALGRIQPYGEVIKLSVANAQDSRVDRILIKEGDRVQANQVIAILQGIERKQADLRDAQTDVKLREVELERVARIDVKKSQIVAQNAVITRLQAQLTSTQKQREAAIVAAQARLQNAAADYQQRDRLSQNNIGLLSVRAKLSNAEAEYQRRRKFYQTGGSSLGAKARLLNAQDEYQRNKLLFEAGAISRSTLDKAQETLSSAQAFAQEKQVDTSTQLDKAAEELISARANYQEKVAENSIQLDKAKAELLTAQSTLNERKAELEQTLKTLTAEIQQEQAKLAELQEVRPSDVRIAQAQLDKAKIVVEQRLAAIKDSEVRVPVAGQILKINTRIGEQVSTSQGIVELAQTDRMYALVEIAEVDIGKIQVGQAALIASEYNSFAGELQGTVDSIGLQVGRKQAQETGGSGLTTDREARVIMVKVQIAPADSDKVAKLTNIQVRVRIPSKKS
jgi:HlyD family secretion protein